MTEVCHHEGTGLGILRREVVRVNLADVVLHEQLTARTCRAAGRQHQAQRRRFVTSRRRYTSSSAPRESRGPPARAHPSQSTCSHQRHCGAPPLRSMRYVKALPRRVRASGRIDGRVHGRIGYDIVRAATADGEAPRRHSCSQHRRAHLDTLFSNGDASHEGSCLLARGVHYSHHPLGEAVSSVADAGDRKPWMLRP
jgi:hypothetical protein